jgi:sugar phosphate isomerase/epimerase
LGSDCVSLWSGRLLADVPRSTALAWLVEGLRRTLEYAAAKHVTIGFEPEPDMLIDSMSRWEELLAQPGMEDLCLTLDVGHLHCQGEGPIDAAIQRWAPRLVNVHIEDMRAGVHEHLMFGEGEIDFPAVLRGLSSARYVGGVHVELSRHSHEGPFAAQKAYDFLTGVLNGL